MDLRDIMLNTAKLPVAYSVTENSAELLFASFNTFIQLTFFTFLLFVCIFISQGHAVAQLVEALCYKPEGRGFDSR
jgi:hypothetical protein